jgi:glucokinase
LLLAPAREAFKRTLTGRGFRPEARIVRAVLGPEAGMVGAADLAREEATWLRRVRVKTTAVTAKTAAARGARSTRLERAARKSVGRRTGMRTADATLKEPASAELNGDTEA